MLPVDRIARTLEIIKSLQNLNVGDGLWITGQFASQSEYDDAQQFLLSEYSHDDLELDFNGWQAPVGFFALGNIERSLERFLSFAQNRKDSILQPIGFIEENCVFNPHAQRLGRLAIFNCLVDMIDLFHKMKTDIADYSVDKANDTILFLTGKTKLEVTDEYEFADLIELGKLEEFKRDFLSKNDPHTKQRKDIFKRSTIGFFEGKNKIKFSEFIQGFDKICEDAHNNLVLYLDDFAFDKIKQSIEKDKLEHITRISKVFSDIQNQLFGVPASVVIVASQVQAGESAKNYAILAGSLLYAVFMAIAIHNQCQTLKAIQSEFEAQLTLLNGRQVAVRALFINNYTDLQTRSEKQERLLYLSGGLVAAGFLATVGVFFLLK